MLKDEIEIFFKRNDPRKWPESTLLSQQVTDPDNETRITS